MITSMKFKKYCAFSVVQYVSVISSTFNSKSGLVIHDQNLSTMFKIGFLLYAIKELQNYRIKTALSIATCLQTRPQ